MSILLASRREASAPWSGPAATLFLSATLVTFIAAASAPTPLYRLYQEHWAFSPAVLTLIFAVYAAGLLAALLTVGSLSDHVGRRPVLLGAIALEAVAMGLFVAADSTVGLIVARTLQGFATGAATSALSAALLDSDRVHGPLINSLVNPIGMAVGALATSALVVLAPWPMRTVYVVLLAVLAIEAVLVRRLAETVAPRPGAWRSLWPSIAVPPQARRMLAAITPINVAVWALGGFYMSLAPSLLREATGSASPFLGGAIVATLTLSGAGAMPLLRRLAAPRILTLGTTILVPGLAIVLAGVHLHLVAPIFIGTAVAGFGWIAAFLGTLRSLLPLAAPNERAGLLAAYYIESYLAMSVPAILAGILARSIGLIATTDIYGGALIALAITALAVAAVTAHRRDR
ncbi:MFS transporter [Siculibacillus lacustris]|uniref:MFS transporter n=1 Tax=Siculibacillus lacustris TaxID=1549641 RepID=A0A4Q9VSE0_9HYPH|nr:MFS transporter [Siculibacillus lacustris]TBW38416.1 MFS transporter [Siculibacillus lacustris]